MWLGPSALDCLDLRLPRKASFLVVCPKVQPIDWLFASQGAPRDIAFVCGPYPTERRALPILQAITRAAPRVVFVGDMDPYAVVQYVETRRMLDRGKAPTLLYGGVDDAWLQAMERTRIRGRRLDRLEFLFPGPRSRCSRRWNRRSISRIFSDPAAAKSFAPATRSSSKAPPIPRCTDAATAVGSFNTCARK